MAASLATVRAAIVARIAAVPDVGVVHDHEPYAADMGALRAMYLVEIGGEPVLRGWFVRRVARDREIEGAHRSVVDEWQIRGFMALSEAAGSEHAFDELIEALAAQFDADEDMQPVWLDTRAGDLAGLQLLESKPVLFAGVLCHMADCRLFTRQRV